VLHFFKLSILVMLNAFNLIFGCALCVTLQHDSVQTYCLAPLVMQVVKHQMLCI